MRCRSVIAGLLAPALSLFGQSPGYELLLREGTVLRAQSLTGDADAGFDVETTGGRRHLAGTEVLVVMGVPAVVPALPAAYLAGGEVVRGTVGGGDSAGNRLELVSPVFGRVGLAVDRLEVLASASGVVPSLLRLPPGVGEALFVRATIGFDVLAGALHQFGESGVRFQPAGSAAPRWFSGQEFAALRLRDAVARESAPGACLLTRVGDRVGIDQAKWTRDGLACELEGGTKVVVRGADVASVVWCRDVVFLSDLVPSHVEESGFDGEVVHPFRVDHNVLGGPLLASGRSPAKGLGVHSKSRLSFRVPDGMERFWTRVAFDDSATTLGLLPRANLEVRVNDRPVLGKQDFGAGDAPLDTGLVPVRPGDTVTLLVEPGLGRDLGDRVDWLCPLFLPPARRP